MMNVIKTDEAAKLVAEEIRDYVLTDEKLKAKCKGDCAVVVGMEPLCREARKILGQEKFSIGLGEARLKFPADGIVIDHARKAYRGVYACFLNSHKKAIDSSFDPNQKADINKNWHGCLGFGITKARKFFKKEKNWARYYIAVQAGGITDIENEQLANRGLEALRIAAELRKLEPVFEPVRPRIFGRVYEPPTRSVTEIIVVAE